MVQPDGGCVRGCFQGVVRLWSRGEGNREIKSEGFKSLDGVGIYVGGVSGNSKKIKVERESKKRPTKQPLGEAGVSIALPFLDSRTKHHLSYVHHHSLP